MKRRTFLKIIGMGSLSFAPGCTSRPEKNLFSLVEAPEDMVTGKATWYASTCRECPAGCGILAKNREGRVIKIEGNPFHPINRGRLCMRGQASLQGVYNPDRITKPLLKKHDGWRTNDVRWQVVSFQEAEAILKEKIEKAVRSGPGRVRMLTEVVGHSLSALFAKALEEWKSPPPLVFEPYAYESLKAANQTVFGQEGVFRYRLEKADVLVSFGADFLETWLSPVEYAHGFKEMHALRNGGKGFFAHVSPYQSLTCANADLWLSCFPEAEVAICLGLMRETLRSGKAEALPSDIRSALKDVSSPFTKEKVAELSGVEIGSYERLAARLGSAQKPLILGAGTGGTGPNSFRLHTAVNLLNAILDPDLALLEFGARHRVETSARRSEVVDFFGQLQKEGEGVLLLNNVNPFHSLPPAGRAMEAFKNGSLFKVSFSNFMDETTARADLIFPVSLPLEAWDEYGGATGIVSMVQPAMAGLTDAPHLGDLLLRLTHKDNPLQRYQEHLFVHFRSRGIIKDEKDWVVMLQQGGKFETPSDKKPPLTWISGSEIKKMFGEIAIPKQDQLTFLAVPSIRFFDGRGANRPWLCEVPDPLTRVAWQSPVLINPQTLSERGIKQGDMVELQSAWGALKAPAYETDGVRPGVLTMNIGQGHELFGRYAESVGANPFGLLSPEMEPISGSPHFSVALTSLRVAGGPVRLAHTDGSRLQHGRKIALTVELNDLGQEKREEKKGLGMWNFPLALPLPEGYDKKRDIYPPHDHHTYRWAMVVDLDRCIGCNACAAGCYAENNLGIVGLDRVREGREMAWLSVERYLDEGSMKRVSFLPMLCQHCDNAPCESVCPVFAPHHSKEGLNNQIYNRCMGTQFCSQNCPYKVRRFNWFDWKWPKPLDLQLNPDVTVRIRGVMEKCSFCVQRIKEVHGIAKDEKREIRDGEVQPACVQTCPTRALIFGNLMDRGSEVRKRVEDRRAYQAMGYLNTKPAVIYLKKVLQGM
jgi:anaerobic selenocysteine-containing dehydrogenase/Fe-S-cluster-containing dehydrogenase component